MPQAEVVAVRRRLTATVFVGVGLGTTALFATFTAAPLIAVGITGSRALAGLPGAAAVLGTAAGTVSQSAVMSRRGRAPGLTLGWGVGTVGAAVGAGAAAIGSFALLIVGMALVGYGHGANQLSRFTVADMYPATRRAFVLSWVVWAGTVSAALGPVLLRVSDPIGGVLDLPRLAGPFVLGCGFFALATVASLTLRPDPSALAESPAAPGAHGSSSVRLAAALRLANVQIALAAMVAAQVTMMLIMTITPVHLGGAGHGLGVIGLVMSGHFVGMFGLAPVAGKLSDRFGSGSIIVGGLALVIAAALFAAVARATSSEALGVVLLVLGLGWSSAFVAGSALLTGGLAYAERVRLQGSADAVLWSMSGIASVGSGLLLDSFGFSVLCMLGAVLVAPALVLGYRRRAGLPQRPSV